MTVLQIVLSHSWLYSYILIINKAAELGGAASFISKLDEGMNAVLEPQMNFYTMNVPDEPDNLLNQEKKKLEKKLDISGGEKQRIVA